MSYSRGFFDLQLRFARQVASLSGQPLERALLDYTNLYIRFGFGRDFDAGHPGWRRYVEGLERAPDWTWDFYRSLPEEAREAEPPGVIARSGCFACARLADGRLRLHFRNAETSDVSPLAGGRQAARRAELTALFQHVSETASPDTPVIGLSWLYNLPAYRRLFPEAYLAGARPAAPRFRNMPLWGQFLDRHSAVRPQPAALFLERLSRQTGMDGLESCFPLQPLHVEAPLAVFAAR